MYKYLTLKFAKNCDANNSLRYTILTTPDVKRKKKELNHLNFVFG